MLLGVGINVTWVTPTPMLFRLFKAFQLCECEFFLEFRVNMYMVGRNEGKDVENEKVKSMYMLPKHVHNMYMGCHA